MHSINDHSTKVLKYLLSLMSKGYLKLDNTAGAFMPVIVETNMHLLHFVA